MISFSTPAFILRSVDIGSVDRIYTLYTRDRGKIDVLAKGIRKADSKLQSSMQMAAVLEVYIIAQRRFTLGGSVIRDVYPDVLQSLPRSWVFQHALDVVNKITRQEHPEKTLFNLLEIFLRDVHTEPAVRAERLLYGTVSFDLHVLQILGHAPLLGQDGRDTTSFALRSDGLHEHQAVRGQPYRLISKEARSLLRFAQQKNPSDCFRVAITRSQAQQQREYMSILLEEYDAGSLQTDRALADFFPK